MATTTTSRTQKGRASTELDARVAELEALGLGIAPGLPGDDRSEFVERAEIGAGQPRRGAPAGHPPAVSPEVVDDAVERAAGRRRVRQALGMPSDRRISNEVIDELLAGASTEEEIAGPGGLLARAHETAGGARDGGRADRPRRLRAPPGAARRRSEHPQRHVTQDAGHRAREGRDRRTARPGRQLLSRRSSKSASGGFRGSTTRSSRSTAAGCRCVTSARTCRRSTASRSASI